jgi:tetratricopeptide (TPR) repeat protein
LGGLLIAPWGGAFATPLAAAAEKSIVESARTSGEADLVVASDQPSGAGLEPIATSSDQEPELADPPVDPNAPAPTPTLADEYVTDQTTKASPASAEVEKPAVEDECIEEEVTATGQDVLSTIEVATFNGATPGVTTRDQILAAWGPPAEEAANGQTLIYNVPGFSGISVRFNADRVESLRISLAQPTPAATLTERLALAKVRPAVMYDDIGSPLSTAFPERGVTFVHRTGDDAVLASDSASPEAVAADPAVEVIMIRPITAAPFVLRAETSPGRAYTCRIADLETALKYDPSNAHARWLLSGARLATGAAATAEALAREAVDLDPRNDSYRLQWVRCLKYLAQYDQAVTQTRAIIEGTTATPIQRAQALEQMALLASLGSREVQERAVPLHNKAIAMADSLATSEDPAVRIPANQILVGAHLAIAEQIACGDFEDKQKFVAQWISRASALVEQMIEAGEADVSLRMQVAITALDAGARLDPPIDPKLWIDEVEQAIAAMPNEADDPLAQAEIDWQMGLAYLHAAEISHRRGNADAALDYGAFADAKIGAAQDARKEMPDTQFVLGRLYFQIGAVHAVHRSDHTVACQWYDRAIEPLSKPVPVTPLAAPGQHADALVSMAVSYWETGDRERAYELTGAGMELVQQGIAEGLLVETALEVPKNNFLAMSRALGKTELVTPPVATPASDATEVAQSQSTAPAKKSTAGPATGRAQARTATRRNAATTGVQRR